MRKQYNGEDRKPSKNRIQEYHIQIKQGQEKETEVRKTC